MIVFIYLIMFLDLFNQKNSHISTCPLKEVLAYEYLWLEKGASFKRIADKFRMYPNTMPSEIVSSEHLDDIKDYIQSIFTTQEIHAILNGHANYPKRLRDALNPIELFYCQGQLDLLNTKCISIVGSRKASEEGVKRTRQLVKHLVDNQFTIISGLAEGIDTAAHLAAISNNGRTIAVIGTSLTHTYPKQNKSLQEDIKNKHLLISQVPFKLYEDQDYRRNRLFFPERNLTMSALSQATIIVEASDTSGTLIQAKAALQQNRKLFILDSCFQNASISWPEKFLSRGAIRVSSYTDIQHNI